MDQRYIIPFIKTTKNLFETMFQMNVEVGAPSVKAPNSAGHDVSGIIGLSGDVDGAVVLSFPMATAQRVVSLFTGVEISAESHEDLSDAVGELVNMVAGGAKAQFDGKSISISVPSVVIGADHVVQQMRNAVAVIVPCQCDCGEFNIEVAFRGQTGEEVKAGVSTAGSSA